MACLFDASVISPSGALLVTLIAMMHIAITLLATSAVHQARIVRSPSVSMSVAGDIKNTVAAVGVAAMVGVLPAASQAVTTPAADLPSSVVALAPGGGFNPKGISKPVDLGDEPNTLKLGFKGLGLTTGFRSKKPAAKAFKAPKVASAFKGALSVKPKA